MMVLCGCDMHFFVKMERDLKEIFLHGNNEEVWRDGLIAKDCLPTLKVNEGKGYDNVVNI